MSLRDIAKHAFKSARKALTGAVDMQELLDKNQVKMLKTKEYEADDHAGKISWSYRFTFDNPSRKKRFLAAVSAYPPQEWDDCVSWWNDISNLKGEICVEARCLVDPDETGKVRYQFEHFVTNELIIKG